MIDRRVEELKRLLLQKEEVEPAQVEVERAPDPIAPEPPPYLDGRPEYLKGLEWQEILILQSDGGLDEAAEDWLSTKNPPSADGASRLPNLKAILRRSKKTTMKGE